MGHEKKAEGRIEESHSPSIQRPIYSIRLTAADPQRPTDQPTNRHSDHPKQPSNQATDRLTQRLAYSYQPAAADRHNNQPTTINLRQLTLSKRPTATNHTTQQPAHSELSIAIQQSTQRPTYIDQPQQFTQIIQPKATNQPARCCELVLA